MAIRDTDGQRETADGRLTCFAARRPFWTMGLSVAVGTGIALLVPWWVALILAVALPLMVFLGLRKFSAGLVAVSMALCLLTATAYRAWHVQPLVALADQEDVITGQVIALPESGRIYSVRVTAAERVPVGTTIGLYLSDEMEPRLWDTVTAQVLLRSASTVGGLMQQGIFLYASPLECDEEHVGLIGSTTQPWRSAVRNWLYNALCRCLPGQEGAMLSALCLGRDEDVPATVTADFQDSGLGHLLVVSGLHLSLVVLGVRWLLRRLRLGRRMASLMTIPVMVAFMALIGASPSILRAGLMCLCWLSGVLLRRRADGLNSLGLAMTCILLVQPYQLWQAGFQLSFLATAGVVCLAGPLCGWLYRRPVVPTRMGRWVWRGFALIYSAAAVCVAATLFTLPVQCYYFGGFSLTAVLANVLAVLPAGWVLLVGWIGLLIAAIPYMEWLAQPILWLAGQGARYLTYIAHWLSSRDWWVSVTALWQWVAVTLLCGLLAYALMKGLFPRRVLAPLLALLVLTLGLGRLFSIPSVRMTVQPVADGVAILLEQQEHTALLVTHGNGLEEAARFARGQNCSRLDCVVVGESSARHAPWLTALCQETGNPPVYTTSTEEWLTGLEQPVQPVTIRRGVELWEGCGLTPVSRTWWQVDVVITPIYVGTDPAVPCVREGGMTVYAGATNPEKIKTPSVVACSPLQKKQMSSAYPEGVWLVLEESKTFTIRPDGEWSVLPWQ